MASEAVELQEAAAKVVAHLRALTVCNCGRHHFLWAERRWYRWHPAGDLFIEPRALACMAGRGPDHPSVNS
jgi:hypothetical protein